MTNIDPDRVPKHVAIVMDGNGRWATRQGLTRAEGHVQGYIALRNIVEAASDLGIKALTVYAFSTENWRRPKDEVEALMHLFARAAHQEMENLQQNSVRMMVSGRFHELPKEVQDSLNADIKATKNNTRLILNLAINYGGRSEIADAARALARKAAAGEISPEEIDEKTFSQYMYAPELPDPDLLIRTAGEMRISNFLMWEIAYAEFYVTQVLWPDFNREELIKAILDYQGRTRRFGAVVEETKQ
ncbi:MAG: isoprenyl transferase [Armatimonadota bacterium]